MRRRLFGVLAAVLALILLEVGSFLILSITQGEIQGHGAIRQLQDSRRDLAAVPVPDQEKDWREHRIANPPALHPFIGYVANPVGHPAAEDPKFSPQAIDHGVPLNTVDLFRPASDDEVVIGVFGGSFAANLAAGGRRLAQQLERYSESLTGKKVRVLSFSVAGHKQPQQLMALNWFLALGVHFDVVINLDGFNEVALPPTTNIPKQYHPFYPRGWLLMVDELDQDMRRQMGELAYLKERRAERAAGFSKLGFSLTAGLIWKILDGPLTRRITEAEVGMLEQERSESGNYQARGPRWEAASEEAMYDELAGLWQRASLQMDALCRGRGIRYLHFLQPNQYLPGSKPLSPQERKKAWDEKHPYKSAVEKAYPRLVRAGEELRREGVEFHDLTRVYEGDERTFYKDACCHVNAQGNVVIAEAIARAIDAGGR